ncbi:hypothetical protein CHS0354_036175 [Potamilus streckersoni]|uniref:Uncharacterized protein n=1 Tax=Potamilus streckersoni TaxID=2493646 RepID=A0AAE0S2L5_9BIVA|nr:hypothetical protein CHS0354_036175 [Potamilus streckersoni]
MVWLNDLTRSFKTEKMTHDDLDLPDELTFHLTSKSCALTLNLKRNHGIDPNVDVYFVQNLKDGQPHLDKALSLEPQKAASPQHQQKGRTKSCQLEAKKTNKKQAKQTFTKQHMTIFS